MSGLSLPFGVYGAALGEPLKGQNWRGVSHPVVRDGWGGARFERMFCTSSADRRGGCVQVRRDGNDWMVALTRPFDARSQTTWHVVRLGSDEISDWLGPIVTTMRSLSDEDALRTQTLDVSADLRDEERERTRRLLPYIRGLAAAATPEACAVPRTVLEPDRADLSADDLVGCVAKFLAGGWAIEGTDDDRRSAAILSAPVPPKEHRELLDRPWGAIFAPRAPDPSTQHGRNTLRLQFEGQSSPIRTVTMEALQGLSDDDFDSFIRGPDNRFGWGDRWTIPARLLPAADRRPAERREALEEWLMAPKAAAIHDWFESFAAAGDERGAFECALLNSLVLGDDDLTLSLNSRGRPLEGAPPELEWLCRADGED